MNGTIISLVVTAFILIAFLGIHPSLVSGQGTPPIAEAGPDQSVAPGPQGYAPIVLDGSGSSDPEGHYPLVNWWDQQSGGVGTVGTGWFAPGTNTSHVAVTVIPQHGVGVFYLVVQNSIGASSVDFVTITGNTPPVANAGQDQSVSAGTNVQLSGSGSSDADNDPLTYTWSFISQPDFSSATITADPNDPSVANFTADWSGTYQVQLVVNDDFVDSAPSIMNVTVSPTQEATVDHVTILSNIAEYLAPTMPLSASIQFAAKTPSTDAVWKNPEVRDALLNKVAVVKKDVESGNYYAAGNKLQNDILTKTDGYALTGAPDNNDWIINGAAQQQVYPLVNYIIDELRQL